MEWTWAVKKYHLVKWEIVASPRLVIRDLMVFNEALLWIWNIHWRVEWSSAHLGIFLSPTTFSAAPMMFLVTPSAELKEKEQSSHRDSPLHAKTSLVFLGIDHQIPLRLMKFYPTSFVQTKPSSLVVKSWNFSRMLYDSVNLSTSQSFRSLLNLKFHPRLSLNSLTVAIICRFKLYKLGNIDFKVCLQPRYPPK